MQELINEARKVAYSESERTGMPVKSHIDLATETAKRLANELGANEEIVEVGTLLMDCMIGQALKENKLSEHAEMSLEKANGLLNNSSLPEEQKENIRHCILEHHGKDKFYSLESEICCNSDCYRFASTKGFSFAMRYLRPMPFEDLLKILNQKLDEKWDALSLELCKKELAPQHKLITEILKYLKETKNE